MKTAFRNRLFARLMGALTRMGHRRGRTRWISGIRGLCARVMAAVLIVAPPAALASDDWQPLTGAQKLRDFVSGARAEIIQNGVRSKEFFVGGTGAGAQKVFADDTMLSNSRQWDVVWPDGDFYKGGIMGQGLYVSPKRDLIVVYFSVNHDESINRFARPIATSGLFD